MPDWDFPAIDGTPFRHGNGKMYFVYSTWAFGPLTIYIAPMESPTVVGGPKVELKKPVETWECNVGCVNEGPYFIFRNNVSFCIFSVSSTWGPDYALAMMSIPGDKDPMNVTNWNMPDGPVFTRNDEESVYTTGHAAFTVSPGKRKLHEILSRIDCLVSPSYEIRCKTFLFYS
jgi:GH43 family beta-xylosidase